MHNLVGYVKITSMTAGATESTCHAILKDHVILINKQKQLGNSLNMNSQKRKVSKQA